MSPLCLNAPFETRFILKLLFYLELFDLLVHSLLQSWWLLKELFFLFPSLTNCKLYRSFVNKIAECLSFHNFSKLPVELHAVTKRTPKSQNKEILGYIHWVYFEIRIYKIMCPPSPLCLVPFSYHTAIQAWIAYHH